MVSNIFAIKKYREKAELSQIDVAESLGVTQGAVSQWENGESNPSSDKLPELAKILGCTIDELYGAEN